MLRSEDNQLHKQFPDWQQVSWSYLYLLSLKQEAATPQQPRHSIEYYLMEEQR